MKPIFYLKITILTALSIFNYVSYAESRVSIDDIIDSLNDELADSKDLPPQETAENLETNELFSYKSKAKIIIMNKITAKSELVEFKLGEPQLFGNLSVEVQRCVTNNDPIKSDNLMLLTVVDNKLSNEKSLVFAGWMDSANLSISTVEHPVYEVIPKSCEN